EIPTPALAYLVREYSADAAVMVSASHNSMEYNGIKWFDSRGYKLSDAVEDEIEAIVRENRYMSLPEGEHIGKLITAKRAAEDYADYLRAACEVRLDGMSIVVDCANGASHGIAPGLFRSLGATVYSIADEPNGCNINERCGSTHPERMAELVQELGADAGFAFDGDADRLIACDEHGNTVDGDKIMGMCAKHLKDRGALAHDTLVITVMSNIGLKKYLDACGVRYCETAVGDRYVLERMLSDGFRLGGEQSGHIIFLDRNTTGDGMLSAIMALNVLVQSGKSMSKLAGEIKTYPQVLLNVIVPNERKDEILADEDVRRETARVEELLGDDGRLLLRASGTEPLIRIMIEGEQLRAIEEYASAIAQVIIGKYGGRIK
ncbi:MAG: phosphoglucosamine mutase, partial [Clostridia bacterium]|nr:phosphoglucosamine mutase [Clostridia bacterium]